MGREVRLPKPVCSHVDSLNKRRKKKGRRQAHFCALIRVSCLLKKHLWKLAISLPVRVVEEACRVGSTACCIEQARENLHSDAIASTRLFLFPCRSTCKPQNRCRSRAGPSQVWVTEAFP